MSNLQSQTKKAFDSIGAIGKVVTGFGIAGAAGLGLAAKSAMDFEAQLSSIKAVSGATAGQMDQLSKLAINMGAKTKYSATEAAQGIEELMKAGVSTKDIMAGGLAGALDLAVAGELDLADAAAIASTALNAFKSDGLTVAKAGDLLAGAANASATSVSELKYGLSMASAVASGVGMTFADTTTALAAFANSGLVGSDAGTSLKTMLLNLSPSTKEAQATMEKLGLATKDGSSAFYDANGHIKSLADISQLLKTQLSGLTDEQRQLALKTMFGTDAIRAANILYKEGASGIKEMYSQMGKVTAADVAKERLNNVKGTIEQLKGAVETASITLGNALLPAIKFITQALQGLVDKFNGLSPQMQQFIAMAGLASVAFALIIGPVLMFVGILPGLIASVTAIAGLLQVTVSALLIGAGVVTLAIAAIVALGVAFYLAYQKIDWFKNAVNAAWAEIVSYWNIALNFISGIVQTVIGAVAGFIGSKLNEIKAFWDENGSSIMKIVQFYFGAIQVYIAVIFGVIKTIFQTVWPLICGIVQIAWAVIKTNIGTAIDLILGLISVAMKLLNGDWSGAWEEIKQTASTIMDNVIGYFEDIDLYQIGKDIIQGLLDGLSDMAGSISEKVSKLASLIPKGLRDFLGIQSPSRITMQLGNYVGQGLVIGMDDQLSQIKSASRDMATAAVPNVQSVKRTDVRPTTSRIDKSVNVTVNAKTADIDENTLVRTLQRAVMLYD